MSDQKLTRREKRQIAKRKKQMQSIGIMIIGVLIIFAGVVLVAFTKPKVEEAPGIAYQNVEGNAIGDPNAPVLVEEYFSFGCSHCRDFSEDKFPRLLQEYIDTGLVYFISYPFTNPTDAYGVAAQAALCAGDQGKYFEMHDTIFANFDAYGYKGSELQAMADGIGLDLNEYNSCMNNGEYVEALQNMGQGGQEAGVESTPNFLINGELAILGNQDYANFQAKIDQALASTGQ
jgi:protein-disulfide isomerase